MDPMEVQALHSDENQFEEEHTPIYKKSKGMENSNIENSKQDDALDTEPNDPIQEKSTEFFGSVAQHFEFIAKNLMEHNNSEVEVQGSDKLNESEVPEEPETDAVSSGEPEVSTAEVWSSAVQAQEDEDQIPTPNDSTQNPVLANDETQDVRDEETPVNGVLNEEEKSMTVEKFVRSLIDKQVKKLQVESEAKIAQFIQEADKIKSMITAMES
ncbi:hypothetical protein K7432_009122 [Basidiobolus ranarum]|uniref:Uncharacterized protein n=1 Tax=Basidiobolus ranarum TaxID=34480 RepID=A0ABR2WQQ4_9FUNG